jgi:hypothetical protein
MFRMLCGLLRRRQIEIVSWMQPHFSYQMFGLVAQHRRQMPKLFKVLPRDRQHPRPLRHRLRRVISGRQNTSLPVHRITADVGAKPARRPRAAAVTANAISSIGAAAAGSVALRMITP